MGIFDFVKTAGAVLTGTIEKVDENALKQKIEGSGLSMKDLAIKAIDDETIKIYAVVPDQATKEKMVLMVGNTQGVGKVEDAIKVRPENGAPEEKPAKFYTVVSGDTLSSIAQKFYGDANRYNEIFEANKPPLSSPDAIDVGQVLRIPS